MAGSSIERREGRRRNRAEKFTLVLDPVDGARTIRSAKQATNLDASGEADFRAMQAWLNNPQNAGTATVDTWKKTINYFLGAAADEKVPCLYHDGRQFSESSGWLGGPWHSRSRSVRGSIGTKTT